MLMHFKGWSTGLDGLMPTKRDIKDDIICWIVYNDPRPFPELLVGRPLCSQRILSELSC